MRSNDLYRLFNSSTIAPRPIRAGKYTWRVSEGIAPRFISLDESSIITNFVRGMRGNFSFKQRSIFSTRSRMSRLWKYLKSKLLAISTTKRVDSLPIKRKQTELSIVIKTGLKTFLTLSMNNCEMVIWLVSVRFRTRTELKLGGVIQVNYL